MQIEIEEKYTDFLATIGCSQRNIGCRNKAFKRNIGCRNKAFKRNFKSTNRTKRSIQMVYNYFIYSF